jgi:hypothetical protein
MSKISGTAEESFASEELTPACNLLPCTSRHWTDHSPNYRNLAVRLGVPAFKAPRLSVDTGSTKLFKDVKSGVLTLAWCPGGISLVPTLFHYFVRRSIGLWIPCDLGRDIVCLGASDLGSWFVFPGRRAVMPSHPVAQGESGIFPRCPSAVEFAYLAAWYASFEEDGQAKFAHPIIPSDMVRPLFVRTSTWLGDGTQVGVAYAPGKALLFASFDPEADNPQLVTGDAILL